MAIRRARRDPRTVAREIPSLFDVLFPQLLPGLVVHLNQHIEQIRYLTPLNPELLQRTALGHAMVFEMAYVSAESLLTNSTRDWPEIIEEAVRRQSRFFDAVSPKSITDTDKKIVEWVSHNLVKSLRLLEEERGAAVQIAPAIRGFGWIANSYGDYRINHNLIEAKCTGKRFSSADYRQVLMYWLLSYADAVENGSQEWTTFTLLNPRLALRVEFKFDDIIRLVSADRSKVELLELFTSIISDQTKIDEGRSGVH